MTNPKNIFTGTNNTSLEFSMLMNSLLLGNVSLALTFKGLFWTFVFRDLVNNKQKSGNLWKLEKYKLSGCYLGILYSPCKVVFKDFFLFNPLLLHRVTWDVSFLFSENKF